MQLVINGEPQEFAAPLTVSELLERLTLDPQAIAVECNLAIVPRSTYGATTLADGDAIEIVQFIGGG